MNVQEQTERIYAQMVEWRRYLHRHPELSFEEKETSRFVYEQLSTMGLDSVEYKCGFSVVAVLHGGKGPGKCIALRADIDALPVTEETGCSYASETPGVMHACGHDGHTAMLLGAAKILSENRNEFAGSVKFIFQNAEEKAPGGAKGLVEAGVMEGPHVDAIFALHLKPDEKCGVFCLHPGPVAIGGDVAEVNITGKAGHVASPHLANDALLAACQYVVDLQQIVSRNIDPLKTEIVGVGVLRSGEASNIVAGSAYLSLNVRAFDMDCLQLTRQRMLDIAKGEELITGCKFDVSITDGYQPLINDDAMTRFVKDVCTKTYGADSWVDYLCMIGGDDFSYYMNATNTPGGYYLLFAGSETEEVYANHHAKFTWKEEVMKKGAGLYVALVLNFLDHQA